MQADIRKGSTGHAGKPSYRQTDLPEGQDVYAQINNNQQRTQTDLPEVHYVYMQTIAVRVDTRTGSTVCTNACRACRQTALQVERRT